VVGNSDRPVLFSAWASFDAVHAAAGGAKVAFVLVRSAVALDGDERIFCTAARETSITLGIDHLQVAVFQSSHPFRQLGMAECLAGDLLCMA